MLTDHRCTKYTDCSSCSFYQRDIFKYRLYPKGYVIPQTRCMQNMVFFLVKGEIWLNSEEHPDTTFRGGQFVLQPIGSKVECKVLDYTECIIYPSSVRKTYATIVSTKASPSWRTNASSPS